MRYGAARGGKLARPARTTLRPAAVLCPLVERPNGIFVILTRRSDQLTHHPGQVAFPGGKVDLKDPSPRATALREAHEEIGLTEDLVDIVGAIDPYETATRFRVTPFVGFVSPQFQPVADPGEVAEVFEAPLDHLIDPARREIQDRGRRRVAYAIPWNGYDIWGATAGMLIGLADRIAAVQAGSPDAKPATR